MTNPKHTPTGEETPEQRKSAAKTKVTAMLERMDETDLNRILNDSANVQYRRDAEAEAEETAEAREAKSTGRKKND